MTRAGEQSPDPAMGTSCCRGGRAVAACDVGSLQRVFRCFPWGNFPLHDFDGCLEKPAARAHGAGGTLNAAAVASRRCLCHQESELFLKLTAEFNPTGLGGLSQISTRSLSPSWCVTALPASVSPFCHRGSDIPAGKRSALPASIPRPL